MRGIIFVAILLWLPAADRREAPGKGAPMAFNPDLGLVYLPTRVFPATLLDPTEEKHRKPGRICWKVGFDRMGYTPARD